MFPDSQQRMRWTVVAVMLTTTITYRALADSMTQVLYTDTDSQFVIVNQAPSGVQTGSKICLIQVSPKVVACDGEYAYLERQHVVFLPPVITDQLEVGQSVQISVVHVRSLSDRNVYETPQIALNKLRGSMERDQEAGELPKKHEETKVPAGGPADVEPRETLLESDDFPDITIPKIRRRTPPKIRKEPTITEETIEKIKKILRRRSSLRYRFSQELPSLEAKKASEKATKTLASDHTKHPRKYLRLFPTPMTYLIEWNIFTSLPIQPLVTLNGIRFRTIRSNQLARDSLWLTNTRPLKPIMGHGLRADIISRLVWYTGLGWRYHRFQKATSRSTFDDVAPQFEVNSDTGVEFWSVHAEYGRRIELVKNTTLYGALGMELMESTIDFRASNKDSESGGRSVVGYGRSSRQSLLTRLSMGTKLYLRPFALDLGAIAQVPIYNLVDTFEGDATIPERTTLSIDPKDDLARSLDHRESNYGLELYLGISYQPQR